MPETGKALVYVIEDQRFKAVNDVTVRVGLDGSWIGANRGNSYLFFSAEPGEHHLCANWNISVYPGPLDNDRQISLNHFTAEPGKVYYFRVRTIGGQTIEPIFDMDQVNSDEGQLLLASAAFSHSQANKQPIQKSTGDPNAAYSVLPIVFANLIEEHGWKKPVCTAWKKISSKQSKDCCPYNLEMYESQTPQLSFSPTV